MPDRPNTSNSATAEVADSLIRTGGCPLTHGGVPLVLLAGRVVWWERTATLLVADLHLGKVTAFAAGGLPMDAELGLRIARADLDRLGTLLAATAARRLIILGDLLHARGSRDPALFEVVASWRQQWSHVEMLLIRGNHDERAGDPPPDWAMPAVNEGLIESGLELRHIPRQPGGRNAPAPVVPSVCGHLHPVVALADLPGCGSSRERTGCFALDAQTRELVLPAFGSFTGGARMAPRAGQRLFVIAGQRVLPIA